MHDAQFYIKLEHTADLAMRVWGADMRALYINAARALFDMMTDLPTEVTLEREVEVESPDAEALLVDWLNELIYLHEVHGETYTRFEIGELTDERLHARIFGAPTVRKFKGIKAATFNDLTLRKIDDRIEATVVFDV